MRPDRSFAPKPPRQRRSGGGSSSPLFEWSAAFRRQPPSPWNVARILSLTGGQQQTGRRSALRPGSFFPQTDVQLHA